MWLYDWEHLTLDHHFANFGGFRYCSRADKTFSICHVISCSIGCVTLRVKFVISNHLAKFGGHRPSCRKDITDLSLYGTSLWNETPHCI